MLVLVAVSVLLSVCLDTTSAILHCTYPLYMYNLSPCSIQSILKHQNVRGNLTQSSDTLEVEDQFDILIDANDQILEKAVSVVHVHSSSSTVCIILRRFIPWGSFQTPVLYSFNLDPYLVIET